MSSIEGGEIKFVVETVGCVGGLGVTVPRTYMPTISYLGRSFHTCVL